MRGSSKMVKCSECGLKATVIFRGCPFCSVCVKELEDTSLETGYFLSCWPFTLHGNPLFIEDKVVMLKRGIPYTGVVDKLYIDEYGIFILVHIDEDGPHLFDNETGKGHTKGTKIVWGYSTGF